METKNSTPILVATKQHINTENVTNWNSAKSELHGILDLYGKMNLPTLSDISQVNSLLNDTEGFIFDQLTGGGIKIVGHHGKTVSVDKHHGLKMITKPAEYESLLSIIADFKKHATEGYKNIHQTISAKLSTSQIGSDFTFKEGELAFSDSRMLSIEQSGNVYAKTEKGQRILRFLNNVCESYINEQLHTYRGRNDGKVIPSDILYFLEDIFSGIDIETKKPILCDSGNVHNLQFAGDFK